MIKAFRKNQASIQNEFKMNTLNHKIYTLTIIVNIIL